MEQRTPEWYTARAGKVTASRVADIIAKTKSGYSASRANYMAQLVAERLTGNVEHGFTNAAMQWGVDTEAEARIAYELHAGELVEEIGFADHPTIAMAGASPDGLVEAIGLVEIKCPNTATHIETLLGGGIPAKYTVQMQWQMACTSRQWCDFVSFDPRLGDGLSLFVRRLERAPSMVADLESEVSVFLRELDDKVRSLGALLARRLEAA
jgi:putative phage-type endonuclease